MNLPKVLCIAYDFVKASWTATDFNQEDVLPMEYDSPAIPTKGLLQAAVTKLLDRRQISRLQPRFKRYKIGQLLVYTYRRSLARGLDQAPWSATSVVQAGALQVEHGAPEREGEPVQRARSLVGLPAHPPTRTGLVSPYEG